MARWSAIAPSQRPIRWSARGGEGKQWGWREGGLLGGEEEIGRQEDEWVGGLWGWWCAWVAFHKDNLKFLKGERLSCNSPRFPQCVSFHLSPKTHYAHLFHLPQRNTWLDIRAWFYDRRPSALGETLRPISSLLQHVGISCDSVSQTDSQVQTHGAKEHPSLCWALCQKLCQGHMLLNLWPCSTINKIPLSVLLTWIFLFGETSMSIWMCEII